MACRANERKGWGGVKTCPVRRLDRRYSRATLNVRKKGDGLIAVGGFDRNRADACSSGGLWRLRQHLPSTALGSRNRPVLVHGLPAVDCPRVWLLAAMNHEPLPLRLRMAAAKALMPFMHPPG